MLLKMMLFAFSELPTKQLTLGSGKLSQVGQVAHSTIHTTSHALC